MVSLNYFLFFLCFFLQIITALKGFGNLGYYGEGINTIIECAISGNSPLPIRIAAIQATRRACAPEVYTQSFVN